MWCFRASGDEIEQEGVRRAVSRSQQADLLIIMISVDELNTDGNIGIDSEIQTRVQKLLEENLKVSLNLRHSSLADLIIESKIYYQKVSAIYVCFVLNSS